MAAVATVACSKKEDVIVKTGADKKLSQEQIDADAGRSCRAGDRLMYVDARALFASQSATSCSHRPAAHAAAGFRRLRPEA